MTSKYIKKEDTDISISIMINQMRKLKRVHLYLRRFSTGMAGLKLPSAM